MKKKIKKWLSRLAEKRERRYLKRCLEKDPANFHKMETIRSLEKELRALKKGVDPHSFDKVAWKIYPEFISLLSLHDSMKKDPEYALKGYKEGCISPHLISELLSLLQECAPTAISHDDFDPLYVHPDLRSYEKVLNQSHKLFALKEKELKAIEPIIEELKEPLTHCLGSAWSVINVVCWETAPEAVDTGPNQWHKDGLPLAVNKVMIYLTGASLDKGTTVLQFEDGSEHFAKGPPGTWLLFKVSEILHRGLKPKVGKRIALEIRVVPTLTYDLRPYCAGFNAHYPKLPWCLPWNRATAGQYSSKTQ